MMEYFLIILTGAFGCAALIILLTIVKERLTWGFWPWQYYARQSAPEDGQLR
jgi:hypothetical protein